MSKDPSHRCHATGCNVEVPPRMFMCLRHWKALSRPRQRAIWATYKAGQEIRKDPSAEYLAAADEAIRELEIKEGRRAAP